jgi:hypothetical protein
MLLVSGSRGKNIQYLQRLVARLPAVERELAVGASSHIIRVLGWCVLPSRLNQLLGLALPSLFGIVGPPASECGFSSFLHVWLVRVLLRIVSNFRLDRGDNCPAAFGSVLQVLDERVVVRFPAVKALMAEET